MPHTARMLERRAFREISILSEPGINVGLAFA